MAFTIPDNLVDVYQDNIDALINNFGKKVVITLPQKEEDCPNCGYDAINQRSNNKYNTNNPNTLNGPLHKPFTNGQRCPVCKGRGRIKSGSRNKEIKATVNWDPKEYYMENGVNIRLPEGTCKLKTFSSYIDDVEDAVDFQVAGPEPVEGNPRLIRCKLYKDVKPRGLKYNRYIEFYVKRFK